MDIELTYDPSRSNLELALLDEAEEPVGDRDADDAQGYELASVTEQGTYYIRISGPAAPHNLYFLQLTRNP